MQRSGVSRVDLRAVDAKSGALALVGLLLITVGIWAPRTRGRHIQRRHERERRVRLHLWRSRTGHLQPGSQRQSAPDLHLLRRNPAELHPVDRGGIDSMPFFSFQGTSLYFSSNRPGDSNNPGANGNFAIYQVAYPATVSGPRAARPTERPRSPSRLRAEARATTTHRPCPRTAGR